MKMTKIKLINWHIFTNHTIEINGDTLITGENASGKSTLMDAVYFLLSGGDQYHFNKAANESGQRNLESYLRGKLGSEKNPYLRPENDVVGYIIIEYYDFKSKQSLCLGCEININSQSKPSTHFFVIYNYQLKDCDFIKDDKPRIFHDLKMYFKQTEYQFAELPDTQKDRRRVIGKEIFKLIDYKRYFELLQNAISFKPIDQVSTFVNTFLLEESIINLDSLREEIRSYQEIHRILIKEKEKIEVLEKMMGQNNQAENYLKNISDVKLLNILKLQYNLENDKENLKAKQFELDNLSYQTQELKDKEKNIEDKIRLKNIEIYQLENNDEYKVLKEKKNQLNEEQKQVADDNKTLTHFIRLIKEEQNISNNIKLNYNFINLINQKDYIALKSMFQNYKLELNKLFDELNSLKSDYKYQCERLIKKKNDKLEELELSKKGLNVYPEDVTNLIDIAKTAILLSNPKETNPDVRPLCEYIEIKDEAWSKAIEGYLGNNKFNLIIDPKYYDAVSEAYNNYFKERKSYIGGIVNIQSLDKFDILENNNNNNNNFISLMDKIEVSNKYAYRYANYLLSRIVCVDNVCELKNYESSITKDVMIYKNHVMKACNPERYKKPFIGRNAIEKRIEILNTEIDELNKQINTLRGQIIECSNTLNQINSSRISELLNYDNYWIKVDNHQNTINELLIEIKEYENSSGLLEVNIQIEKANSQLNDLNKELVEVKSHISSNDIEWGKINGEIDSLSEKIINNQKEFDDIILLIDKDQYDSKYQEYVKNNKLIISRINKDIDDKSRYNESVKPLLLNVINDYSRKYRPSLPSYIENLQDFVNEYYNLKNRDVAKYEDRAKEAYENAEHSFKEDFIAKLKEKIEKSQKTLKKLNNNLALHPFGNDQEIYKFDYQPNKDSEFSNYYRIIMSGKLQESNDLFSEVLDEKDSLFMKELFNKIAMETNDAKAEQELERYLDYRNYMNYDIEIKNKYGDVSYFSKINKEKSGGETQTPFYIVMASCFDELMNKEQGFGYSTCQVVFDEAFNNMDESRIKSLMEFYKQLNIQIMIIVPSNRISAISPYMDSLIGIVKNNNYPFIQDMKKI